MPAEPIRSHAEPARAHGDLSTYHLELERVRLRAMLAIERLSTTPSPSAQERMGTELARVDAQLAERRPTSRAHALAQRLGLGRDDLELLWNAVAIAADPRVVPHAIVLGGPDARRGVTLNVHALIAELDGTRARSLSQRLLGPHPLVRDHLLVWSSPESPAARPFAVPPRTITWLAGDADLDAALAGSLVPLPARLELDARQTAAASVLPGVLDASPAPLIVVEGALGTGRRTAIAHAAARSGRVVIALELRRVPHGVAALEAALIGLRRECRLAGAIPLVADIDELTGEEGEQQVALRALARVIDDIPGPFAVTSGRAGLELPVTRPLVRVRWNVPDTGTRRTLWTSALGDDAARLDPHLDGVAHRYRMGAGGIGRSVASARLIAAPAPVEASHLVDGVRINIAERLGELAVRQETSQTWDDLVLAPDILDQVKTINARVRHAHRVLEDWGFASKLPRGAGVAVLFSGPPGTGKTMVAGLIARELDLELYQVDLSKIVSKWVGETEKQLARVFEAAEAGHALLLFDEADALFAKRTEVKSSVDRYANLEVNYLLQRIESFGGVSILTTNLEASIDPALRRRLAANVVFWPPDVDERQRLWQRMLTSKAPLAADIDVDRLAADYDEMTGANIRNAVLAAAFLAASEGSPITQARLERAARGEYLSMGRVLGKGGV